MKLKRVALYLILFCSFFLVGFCSVRGLYVYASGRRSLKTTTQNHSHSASTKAALTTSSNKPDMTSHTAAGAAELSATESVSSYAGNGQQNILLIGVDDLSAAKPGLENAWLVLHLQNSPQITLLPIYPDTSTRQAAEETIAMAELFKLNQDHQPDPDFIRLLKARDIWWSNFVVLDREAMASIVEFVGGEAMTGHVSGPDAVMKIPLAAVHPDVALLSQARLAQELCQGTKKIPADRNISSLIALIPDHVAANLDLDEVKSTWSRFFEHGNGFTCEFPTLSSINSSSQ